MKVLANPYARALILSTLMSVVIAGYAWRRKPAAGAIPITVFMLAAAEWSMAYALELGSTDLATKVFWAKAQYLGIVLVAPAVLALVIQYIDWATWLTRRNILLLSIVPVITLVLVWTNEAHGLIWADVALSGQDGNSTLDIQHGAGFWVIVTYSYACILLGTVLLARRYRRFPDLFRGQTSILLLGSLVPWAANLLYVTGLSPFPHIDLTPIALALTGLVTAWGLFRFQLLNIVPIARSSIVENMQDGVIVLDAQARILDINPAARRLLAPEGLDPIGRAVEWILPQNCGWMAHLDTDTDTRTEITLGEGEARRHFDLLVSVQRSRQGEPATRVILLHETSLLKKTEVALRESRHPLEGQNVDLRKLSRPVEQSADTVMVTGTDGTIEHANPNIGPIHDAQGPAASYVAIEEDTMARKKVEDALSHLLELGRVLTASRDMAQAIDQAIRSTTEIVPSADRGTLQFWDQDGETLRTVAVSDTDHGADRPCRMGEDVAGQALISKKIVNIPDVLADERYVPGPPGIEFRSLLVAPLLAKEKALGTLSLSSAQANAFSATDETLAGLMADQIAVALENAQEFAARQLSEEAIQRQRERITVQHEIVQSILAARLPETIAVAAIGRIRKLIPSQRAMIMAIEEDGRLGLLAAESSPEVGPTPDESAYQELLRVPALNGGWVHGADNLETMSRRTALQEALYRSGVRSYIVVPLFVQGGLVGTLNAESGRAGAFSPDHIAIATEVAASLALAIRQARLYEQAQQEIVERVQAEEALRQHTSELEARNAELDAFAHTVAHDLKSPVGTIVGYCELLIQKLDTLPPDTSQELLTTIARNSMRMGTIIDELLLLASVRGVAEVKVQPLNMARIISEVLDRLRYRIRDQEAEISMPECWPSALGHDSWVEEVWFNYISNALKYGNAPPRLWLGAEVVHEGAQICFWVRDNGDGLSPQEQARLFTPFERLHQVRVEGHGLGLSIVQRIVQKLGGEVGVESEGVPGEGSRFYFTLPAATADPVRVRARTEQAQQLADGAVKKDKASCSKS